MHQHEHAAHGVEIEPGTPAWSEWVKDYYRDVETYDWVDVADNLRGLEAFFHRNRARVVRAHGRQVRDAERADPRCRLRDGPEPAPPARGLDRHRHQPAQRRAAAAPPAEPHVIEGDVEALPFADGSFGTVLCTEVIEHIPDPSAALAEYRRVLQPGGVLIGSVPARSAIWKLRFLSSTCPHSEPFHNEYLPQRGPRDAGRLEDRAPAATRCSTSTSCSWPARRPDGGVTRG